MKKPIPDYPVFSPYLTVRDAGKALAFYQQAFGATERFRLTDKRSGKVGHAEIMIQGNLVMLSEENAEWGSKGPPTLGGTPVTFCLLVDNADQAFERAIKAGATELTPPADQFYGFRSACVADPSGHQWMLQHQTESISPEEMQARWDKMGAECSGASDAKA